MRHIKFQPCEITFTTQDEDTDTTYCIEGIRFKENDKDLFIVIKLLSEKIPYIKHEGREEPVIVGSVLVLIRAIAQKNIVIDKKKFKYWTQFVKMRHI